VKDKCATCGKVIGGNGVWTFNLWTVCIRRHEELCALADPDGQHENMPNLAIAGVVACAFIPLLACLALLVWS